MLLRITLRLSLRPLLQPTAAALALRPGQLVEVSPPKRCWLLANIRLAFAGLAAGQTYVLVVSCCGQDLHVNKR